MSKKTRKKSPGPSPAKTGRAKATSATQKPGSKTRQTPAPKSAKKAGKKSVKATVKKATAKKTGKAVAKIPAKAARRAVSNKAVSDNAASKKAASASVRAEEAMPGTAVMTKDKAATPATKTPVATQPPEAPGAAPSHATPATEGGPAPSFNLPRDGGERVSLADYAGQKLVIFFYPRADTPGCTREAID